MLCKFCEPHAPADSVLRLNNVFMPICVLHELEFASKGFVPAEAVTPLEAIRGRTETHLRKSADVPGHGPAPRGGRLA